MPAPDRLTPLPDTLLREGGLDAAPLHALVDGILADHSATLPGDSAEFLRSARALAKSEAQRAEWDRQIPALERRGAAGRVRHIAGAPADLLFDLAARLAPLILSGRGAEANMIANRYLDVRPQGATGWAALPLFLSLQLGGQDPALAEAVLRPGPPRLVAIGGLSGTGKSTLSRLIGVRIGRTPGARVLRSDVFRKRLAGVSPEHRLPPGHYTRQSDEETYEALFESADDHLACGSSVILDAVFMNRSERDVVEALALHWRIPFTGIWLEAPERDRIARATARTNDASDADATVVRAQSHRPVGTLGGWHRMRVNRPIDLIVPAARAILERKVP